MSWEAVLVWKTIPYRIQQLTVVIRLAFVSNDRKSPHQLIGRSVSFSVDETIHLTSSMSIASPHSIVSPRDTLARPSKSTPSISVKYYSSSDRSVSEEQLEYKGGTRKVLTLDLREPLWQLLRGQYRPSRYSVHHAEVLRQRLGRHLNLELRLCRAARRGGGKWRRIPQSSVRRRNSLGHNPHRQRFGAQLYIRSSRFCTLGRGHCATP